MPLADDGTICVTSSACTHVVVDAFGGFGTGGLARELSIGGATMFPAFAPVQHDYLAYCQSTTANQLTVHACGMPRTQVTVGSTVGSTVVDTTLLIDADDAIVVRITPTGGGATDEYWIRCVPRTSRRSPSPAMTTAPPGWYRAGEQQRTDRRCVRDDHGLGGRARLVQAGSARTASHSDLKRLGRGSLAWFQTFGPGYGNDPTNGYENFPSPVRPSI